MLMTTPRLLALRTYNITLGRFGWAAKLLRKILVRKLITSPTDRPYMASSRFFDFAELDDDRTAQHTVQSSGSDVS